MKVLSLKNLAWKLVHFFCKDGFRESLHRKDCNEEIVERHLFNESWGEGGALVRWTISRMPTSDIQRMQKWIDGSKEFGMRWKFDFKKLEIKEDWHVEMFPKKDSKLWRNLGCKKVNTIYDEKVFKQAWLVTRFSNFYDANMFQTILGCGLEGSTDLG